MYKCEFPGCDYMCESRSQIQLHHIVPREFNGSDKPYNRIYLCPNCHTKVYIPGVKSGIHSIKTNDSIIINRWLSSTDGRVLEYINNNGDVDYYFIEARKK